MNIHMPSMILSIFSYLVIGLLFCVVYKKQQSPPKIWKGILITFIGVFSFSISLNLPSGVAKVAILPLGVIFLYWFLRRKDNGERWLPYRRFAWLGFWANFIFLAFSFLNTPLDHLMFPKNQPSTYMNNVEEASLMFTHPAAKAVIVNKEMLQNQMNNMKLKKIIIDTWFNDINEENGYKERFPYVLTGALPAKGSGLETVIYVEDDGKGFLITNNRGNQVYFRAEESVLTGGAGKND